MLPLPPSMFDACDWRGVKADRTGTVTIDSNRYLAGPKWHSMRLMDGGSGSMWSRSVSNRSRIGTSSR